MWYQYGTAAIVTKYLFSFSLMVSTVESSKMELVPYELGQTGQTDVNTQPTTDENDEPKKEMNNQNVLDSSSMNPYDNLNNTSTQHVDNNTNSYSEVQNETF